MYKLEEPLNATERYLYGVSVRLEILIDLVSSLVEVYAEDNDIPVENNTVEEIVLEEIEEEVNNSDLKDLTVAELKVVLDNLGIEYTSSMRKNDLISLLE